MQSHPEAALRLVREGCTLVCANVPERTDFGIDMMSWQTGAKFKGVKMIPAGIHLLSFASRDGCPRSGCFLVARPGAVVVAEWDGDAEQLRFGDAVDSGVAASFSAAAQRMELDAYLGAYPLEKWEEWSRLVNHVTPRVVDRISPVGGVFLPEADSFDAPLADDTAAAAAGATAGGAAHDAAPSPVPLPYFSPVLGCGKGSAPAARTAYAMDTSPALAALLAHAHRWENMQLTQRSPARPGYDDTDRPASPSAHVLGELQAAFVLFLMAQSMAGLTAWKRLVDVLCRAEAGLLQQCGLGPAGRGRGLPLPGDGAAPPSLLPLFAAGFRAIAHQLPLLPSDMMVDELLKGNFLRHALGCLAATLTQLPLPPVGSGGTLGVEEYIPVLRAGRDLLAVASQRFGWSFTATDSEAPGGGVLDNAGVPIEGSGGVFASEADLIAALRAQAGSDEDMPAIA